MVKQWLTQDVQGLASKLVQLGNENLTQESITGYGMKNRVIELLDLVRSAMFPNVYETQPCPGGFLDIIVRDKLSQAAILLESIVCEVLVGLCEREQGERADCKNCCARAGEVTVQFMESLADISALLHTDITAAYNGDPAAISKEEILLSYPAFEAISIYRLANKLHRLHVPLVPRIMTEYAHQLTGIDIHPGATIGKYFFIDHGTGVVIGETCTIGDNVKLYQGVTLGAKSFELDSDGNPVKGIKRHPDIQDHVVIYSGATILGGDTVIGHHSTIGGNVWLMSSVEPWSTVYNTTPSPSIREGRMDGEV